MQTVTAAGQFRTFGGIILIAGMALGLVACRTPNHEATHDINAAYAKLELNDGKKWVVDKPMMLHIRNLEKTVAESNPTSSSDHTRLATDVQENLGRLVTKCTMEGKAHDELHKWLMPFLGLSADYTKATEPAVQNETLQEIKESLVVFNRCFE